MSFALRFLVPGLLITVLCRPAQAQQPPDTIYFNGKIITMWAAKPTAQAISIAGDRFQAVGTNAEVLKSAGLRTKKVDLAGRSVVPGLIDSHVHPITSALSEIDGPEPLFHSIPEIQDYIATQTKKAPASKLILVPKVYSTRLKERRYPTRQELDQAAPSREVIVDNGYSSVLNSVLLKRMGITRDSPQPKNGRFVKDEKGELTGLVLGAPQLLATLRGSRKTTAAERLWALEQMQAQYNRVGITSITDRSEGPDGFRAYQTLHEAGRPPLPHPIRCSASRSPSQSSLRLPFGSGPSLPALRSGPPAPVRSACSRCPP